MAELDLDALKNRLNSLENKVQKTDNLWKPKPGKQEVRILPYVHNEANPFIELYFHYGFGGKNILSPKTFGDADPLCELADHLYGSAKVSNNQDDYKMAQKLTPKMRTYVPVIVRGEEAEGVKFWGFGKNVYKELIGLITDPDYAGFIDPVNGRDITVEFKTAEQLGKNFPETYIRPKPSVSPVSEDPKILELVKDQIELPTIFKKYEYAELKKMLESWVDTGQTEADTTEQEVKPTQSKPEAKTEAPEFEGVTAKKADVGSSFNALFNK